MLLVIAHGSSPENMCHDLAAQGQFNFMTDSSIEMRDRVASGGLDGASVAPFGAPIAAPKPQDPEARAKLIPVPITTSIPRPVVLTAQPDSLLSGWC